MFAHAFLDVDQEGFERLSKHIKVKVSMTAKTVVFTLDTHLKNPEYQDILSPQAIDFVLALHKAFDGRRHDLLETRRKRQVRLSRGKLPEFAVAPTSGEDSTYSEDWKVAKCPADLENRRVEITGPVDAKTIINALNSQANVFMADFEDSTAPSWRNILDGQVNLKKAVRRTLTFKSGEGSQSKEYKLKERTAHSATLVVRPRGWHMQERHVLIQTAGDAASATPVSASLFDFGLFFFHNAKELIARGSGPYFYLPKLESHTEARLWNDVFNKAQDLLGIPRGTIRATVLIETITAAFEMEAILFELKEHVSGLNAGRWDYIFSLIKRFGNHKSKVLSDRSAVTMETPFMRAYCHLLVDTCHKRGAHAMGGMSAFIPNKSDPEVTSRALSKVSQDKKREVMQGFDGTWVAHPDLIAHAWTEFYKVLGDKPHQKDYLRKALVMIGVQNLLDVGQGAPAVTEDGARANINVSLQYLTAWLGGRGAVAIHNLMEDAATAEISRAQLWQWLRHKTRMTDGRVFTRTIFRTLLAEEMDKLSPPTCIDTTAGGATPSTQTLLNQAKEILSSVVLKRGFEEFLTTPAYEQLLKNEAAQTAQEAQTKGPEMTDKTAAAAAPAELTASPAELQVEAPEAIGTGLGAGETPAMAVKAVAEPQQTSIISPSLALDIDWRTNPRWQGIKRTYSGRDVLRLRPSILPDASLARHGAEKLWKLINSEPQVIALGAMNGSQAVQMAKSGLKAIYLSGWQVAADANLSGHTYPDQSLYPSNSAPALVKRLNNAMMRHDQVLALEGKGSTDCYLPIVADAEAGFGGPLQAFELMKMMVEAGAAGVHFEDQLAAEKKCGHMGGKVLVPTSQFVRTLSAARMAADLMDVPTIIIARTDALDATLLTSDIDERDRPFITGERTAEGFYRVKGGMDSVIARALAYAPYADLIWFESSRPDLAEAKKFADAVHAQFPGKMLAYNCSPSFNWKKNLDDATIAKFNSELGQMGYKFQFITLAGWHSVNLSAFKLAGEYAKEGMSAYVRLQEEEFALADKGYTAVRHQAEVGAGWFDNLLLSITGGESSTAALSGSTEEGQFHGDHGDKKK